MSFTLDTLKDEYQSLWDKMVINTDNDVPYCVKLILRGEDRYKAIVNNTAIPWQFVGICHLMEGSCNFSKHIHNGDSLKDRTVQVPKGRPIEGNPPFTFEDSCKDWIELMGYDKINEWSVPQMLFLFESNNGFGYRKWKVNSPYLWSQTNNYISGKYVADGKFDENAVSKQTGCAPILKRLLPTQTSL